MLARLLRGDELELVEGAGMRGERDVRATDSLAADVSPRNRRARDNALLAHSYLPLKTQGAGP